ncbi:MAG: M23 family metallopeptidase [Parvibaculales bacterium]
MAGFFSNLLFAGLLNLTPVPLDDSITKSDWVETVSGDFSAGSLVAMQLAPDIALEVDGITVKVHNQLAVFGYGRDAKGESHIILRKNGEIQNIRKTITAGVYDIQHIEGVEQKYVTPPEHVLARISAEAKQKRQARTSQFDLPAFRDGFHLPLKGRVSGVYGSQRIFNGEPRRPHYGLDIAAPAGTPVHAMLAGRVTLAETDMYYEGGLIFIDHGLDVISAYLHLGEVRVKAGDKVEKGQIIGAIGAKQGRSTGAHLDWRVYWQNKRLDPAKLLSQKQQQQLNLKD